ncbi:MAG: hypothetical protein ACOC44_03850 [Promethearchaeia archaeon]
MTKKEVTGIWKYLHHILSGLIILIEGIILFISEASWFFSVLFISVGCFLFIDDLLAETIGISIFEPLHSDPIHLKIAGIIFFIIFQTIFVYLIIFNWILIYPKI